MFILKVSLKTGFAVFRCFLSKQIPVQTAKMPLPVYSQFKVGLSRSKKNCAFGSIESPLK